MKELIDNTNQLDMALSEIGHLQRTLVSIIFNNRPDGPNKYVHNKVAAVNDDLCAIYDELEKLKSH